MKHTFRLSLDSRRLVLLTAALLLLGFTGLAVAAKPDKPPCHPHCDGPGDMPSVELTITYDFDGASSTVTTTGTKRCDEQGRCNFNGEIDENATVPLHLPESLIDGEDGLLAGSFWRGTELDPEACFEDGYADADGRGVELAYDYQQGTWFTAIGAYAWDISGEAGGVTRKYVFYFLCDTSNCALGVTVPSMEGTYSGGRLLRIEGNARDRGGKSIPCRCTISNDPPCPDAVIPLSITVEEVQLD